jgi:hypothetical protein
MVLSFSDTRTTKELLAVGVDPLLLAESRAVNTHLEDRRPDLYDTQGGAAVTSAVPVAAHEDDDAQRPLQRPLRLSSIQLCAVNTGAE